MEKRKFLRVIVTVENPIRDKIKMWTKDDEGKPVLRTFNSWHFPSPDEKRKRRR